MTETSMESSGSSASNTYLLVPILLLIIAVLRSPNLVSSAGIGSAVIVMTPLVLATYALMALAIAGRGTVDLSVGPLIGFINVTLIQLSGAGLLESPLLFFLFAIGTGVAYQLLMGLIIVYVRVQPIIVALSGYLALSGINLVILPRPGGVAPDWMSAWGLGTTIYSPVLVILVLCTVAWLIFTRTAFYGHLRLMGSDERSAYTSGVRITIVRLGAHCIAGAFSAMAALTYTALIGSGDPTQGTTYTLIAVTALVLGGTSLAGGRGGVIGSLLGAVNLFLIGYVLATFSFGEVQGFVTDLAYGLILVLSLLLTIAIPFLQARIRNVSPFLIFLVLSLLFFGVILHAKYNYAAPSSLAAAAPMQTDSTAIQAVVAPEAAASAPMATTGSDSAVAPSAAASQPEVPAAAASQVMLAAAAPVAPPEMPAATVAVASSLGRAAPTTDFAFERWDSPGQQSRSILARPVTLAALLLISLLIVARALVLQTRQQRFSPRMVVILLVLTGLAVFLAATSFDMPASVPASAAKGSP